MEISHERFTVAGFQRVSESVTVIASEDDGKCERLRGFRIIGGWVGERRWRGWLERGGGFSECQGGRDMIGFRSARNHRDIWND